MNTSLTRINASGEPQVPDESHDDREGKTPFAANRLLVVVTGDCMATKALMERLVARQCPIGGEGDGLAWIEMPSRFCYFVFAGIKIIGDPWLWQTSQLELDAEAVSTNRIVIAPCCKGIGADLVFDRFNNANVSIKTFSAPSLDQAWASAPAHTTPENHDPLDALLSVIGEFAEQENLLAHVGGY